MTTTTVGQLQPGQVISMADTDLDKSTIVAISEPVGGVRFIHLLDLESGTPSPSRLVLGVDCEVRLHAIDVQHHVYTNLGADPRSVVLGSRSETVLAGGKLYYTGVHRPDVFPPDLWSHQSSPLSIDRESRPL